MKKYLTFLFCLCVLVSICPMALLVYSEESDDMPDTIYDESGVNDNGLLWIEDERPPLGETVEDEPDLYGSQLFDSENTEQLSGERVLNEILIKFKSPSQVPGKEKQLRHEIGKFEKIGFVEGLDVYVVRMDELEKNPNAVLNRLKNNKYIEYVEPNYVIKSDGLEPLNDAAYTRYLSAITKMINAPAGWDMFAETGGGSPNVAVAVVDSGVTRHNFLPILRNGYASVAGFSEYNDKTSHGTCVAGVIGAIGGRGNGVAGINWNASIMPVKVDDNNGTMSVANVAKGVMWSVDNGARVINMSLGTASDSATLKSAVDYAYNKGCAIFAATGNDGAAKLNYPAAYGNVMAIGSSNNGTTRTATSTYGTGIDIVACGTYLSTTAAGATASVGGTSFASPQAAGLASLIWALNPSLTNQEVYNLIRQGAKPLSGGYNIQTGYGLIDIGATLKLAADAGIPVVPPAQPKTYPTIILTGFAEVTYAAGANYTEDGYKAIDCDGKDISERVQVSDNIDKWTEGLYAVTYSVTDDYGATTTATRAVKVEPGPPPPQPDELPPQLPTITANGSGIIILHIGGTEYREQSARAIDYDGENISGQVEVTGKPDTAKAGTYTVTYRVTGKSGAAATATRIVQVLAPNEIIEKGRPYSFNSQAKQGATVTHTNIIADSFGWMDFKITSLDKNMTITVEFIDSASKQRVFKDTFSAAGSKQYQINEGKYELKVTIDKANGNSKYDISLLMPEVRYLEFAEEEVPLANSPQTDETEYPIYVIYLTGALLIGLVTVLMLTKKSTFTK